MNPFRAPAFFRDLPAAVVRAAFFSALTLAAACSRNAAINKSSDDISVISGLRISETRGDIKQWRLNSAIARLDEKKGDVYFIKPHVEFFKDNSPASIIDSEKGVLYVSGKNAELRENIVVNSKSENMTLKTEILYFSAAKNKIWTDRKVRIIRGKTTTNGVGFRANPDLSEIEIENQETKLNY